MSYLGKMPQRVFFTLILLLAMILTGLRDNTSWLPRVPAPPATPDIAGETAPTFTLAAR